MAKIVEAVMMMLGESRVFRYSCVKPRSLKELEFIIDNSKEIKYKDFLRNVDNGEFEDLVVSMGYKNLSGSGDGWLHIKDDWAVSFHESKLPNGKKAFYMCHSAIEYVFY